MGDKSVQNHTNRIRVLDWVKENDIGTLLKKIESSLQWGDSIQWTNYDFDRLAELIFEKTGYAISTNTLKRVWGRIKYNSKPSETTLNTLSQFLGFKDFREFKSSELVGIPNSEIVSQKKYYINWPLLRFKKSHVLASIVGVLVLAFVIISNSSKKESLNPEDFYFTSRKVTQGIPNTVIFEYDARNAPIGANIEIQQSWDNNRRQAVSKDDSIATSLYFEPGFFNAKLVVNGEVVKEHDLLIPSDGWKAKLESKDQTLYFSDSSLIQLGLVSLGNQFLKQGGIDEEVTPINTSFRYVDDFNGLRVNDLSIETVFRNSSKNRFNLCQNSSLILLMEGEIIKIPVSKKGCVADLEAWHFDKALSGKNNDLSKLGVESGEWITLKIQSNQNKLLVFLNNEIALQLPMEGRQNRLNGLIYHFEGMGEIRSLELKSSEKIFLNWPLSRSTELDRSVATVSY